MLNHSLKKLFLKIFLIAVFPLGSLAIYNYTLDPYCVLGKDPRYNNIEPNIHFLKRNYLKKNKNKYDSYIFGSSRISNIDVKKIPGGVYYNMYYSESIPPEELEDIRWMIKEGFVIKNVLIALDDFSFKIDPKGHGSKTLYRRPPPGNLLEDFNFYLSYVFAQPDFKILKSVLKKNKDGESTLYDLYDTGEFLRPHVDKRIEKDIPGHIKSSTFLETTHYGGDRIKETVKIMAEIKEICEKYNIGFKFFINPLHKTTYFDNDIDQLNKFKRELSRVSGYWDFSGLNSITTNNYYYYETSHFRSMVADMVIARIFGLRNIRIPDDFGYYVTAKNVEQHIEDLKRSYNADRKSSSAPTR
ncbi:MAG TPA: hypothetical protein PL155_05440 [Candidatus Omnitrophota bacterium]|nr:hypothetical protein [Candidatus Omnitrophota bacterium]HPD84075.1 hypothetical protein [Candidatus Omnitrophota bacterium]HRZ02932.1 hypothetical protein [Candidatus Omnitrophota bacterium]